MQRTNGAWARTAKHMDAGPACGRHGDVGARSAEQRLGDALAALNAALAETGSPYMLALLVQFADLLDEPQRVAEFEGLVKPTRTRPQRKGTRRQ